MQAIITGPSDVAVGRTIVLDAESSKTTGEKVTYEWFIGNSRLPVSRTVQAVYTPERPGAISFRLVVTAVIGGKTVSSEALHPIIAFSRKIVLLADPSVPEDKIAAHKQAADEAKVYLRVLQPQPSATPAGNEDVLVTLLAQNSDTLAGANALVVWTDGITGLQALLRAAQGSAELTAGIKNQTIVLITDQGVSTVARAARGPYAVLQPQRILVTHTEAIAPLIESQSTEAFLTLLSQRDIEVQRVDSTTAGLRPWNVLTYIVNGMIAKGVPTSTVILLLVLPIIATILAFFKQVVGITTFGLYTPSIIALSFLALGWGLGVLFLFFIILTGYATRALMKRWRLLYIPKVAIILTVVSITLLLLLGTSAFFGVSVTRETVFILLVMSTLAESFLNLKTEEGWNAAILGISETIAVALLCVFIVQWGAFQSILLAYPELILLTLVINAVLGRYSGLRLVEYFRFQEVFRHLQEEE
ncbi:hypothetical protein HZA45_00470 [Candidatus Peregrinibacteria bacterium]|nr:hypothetical protein [Candidatus Peregrinibacteria bacterium]